MFPLEDDSDLPRQSELLIEHLSFDVEARTAQSSFNIPELIANDQLRITKVHAAPETSAEE